VTDFGGSTVPEDRDFFVPPPSEVGEVRRAWSDIRQGQLLLPLAVKLGIAAIVAVGIFTAVAVGLSVPDRDTTSAKIMGGVLAVGALGMGLVIALKPKRILYLGSEGVAMYTTVGTREQVRLRLVRFADAAAMRASQVDEKFEHLVYTGTKYQFELISTDRKRVYKWAGTRRRGRHGPRANTRYSVAVAVEREWTKHYVGRMEAQMARVGEIEFILLKTLLGTSKIIIRPGHMEFVLMTGTSRVEATDIKLFMLHKSAFTLHTKEAKTIGFAGKFMFNYGMMDNSGAFIVAMERWMKYPLSTPNDVVRG
jgi:hypothetical protein